ncbi:MAG: ABC transporter ATP-binding protein [Bacteroidetes bacterium]|nr:ABC transporter ATP-binding protein [Bacteroidota bacterium]
MIVIETKNVTKVYEGVVPVTAVDGVSIQIEEGEFTAIVGPSGSGKTTLLNLIGGLDHPTTGEVWIGGKNISHLSKNELIDFRLHHIGFVFQAYNLIPVLSAKENVEFIMLLQKRSKSERISRAKELLKMVGLETRMNNRPGELSGGQQQRVAVARALASKPQFVLADEPTANLDSNSTAQLLDMMHDLNKKEKMTFLFSTHDQRVIDRAERVIMLEDGKVVGSELNG